MVSSSTATTVFLLSAGGLLAATALVLGRTWEAKKEVSGAELAASLVLPAAFFVVVWAAAGDSRPSGIHAFAAGVRGASGARI